MRVVVRPRVRHPSHDLRHPRSQRPRRFHVRTRRRDDEHPHGAECGERRPQIDDRVSRVWSRNERGADLVLPRPRRQRIRGLLDHSLDLRMNRAARRHSQDNGVVQGEFFHTAEQFTGIDATGLHLTEAHGACALGHRIHHRDVLVGEENQYFRHVGGSLGTHSAGTRQSSNIQR